MSLSETQSPELLREMAHHNYPEWGPPLTEKQYHERETILRQQPFSLKGNRTWLVRDKNGAVAAHCETFDRPVWVFSGRSEKESHKDHHANDDHMEGLAASVASVFTRLDFRGRGLASEMMKSLRKQLHAEGYLVSNLYSDVGPHFYSREGLDWKVHDAREWVVEVTNGSSHYEPVHGIRSIDTFDLMKSILNDDLVALKQEARELARKSPHQKVIILPPSMEAYSWQRSRSVFVMKQLFPQLDSNVPWGCVKEHHYFAYFFDVSHKILYLSRCRTGAEVPLAMLRKAIEDARHFGMKELHWWNPPIGSVRDLLQQFPGSVHRARTKDSLPSLAVLFQQSQDVVWSCNEKFAWV